jgi:hypothetical protein
LDCEKNTGEKWTGKVDSMMDLQAAWIAVRREKIQRSRRTRFIFPSAFVDMAEFVSWPAVHQASSTSLELLDDFEQRLGINSGLGVVR